MQCADAANADLAPPQLEQLMVPAALAPALASTSSVLQLTHCTFQTTCEQVSLLQDFLCTSQFIYGSGIQVRQLPPSDPRVSPFPSN